MAGQNSYGQWNNVDSELKAHSSALTNERISGLLVLVDEAIIIANRDYSVQNSKNALIYIKQVWKNFRPVVRSSSVCRTDLKLNTKADGVYVIDVWLAWTENIISKIERGITPETIKVITWINKQIENIEILVRDVMQYFKFNFRTENRTKPDIFQAAENMSNIVDKRTEEDLLSIVGKNNRIDWSDEVKDKIINYSDSEELEDEELED